MKDNKVILAHETPFAQAIKALTRSVINANVGLAIYGEVSSEYIENKNEVVSVGFSPENRKRYEEEIERIAKSSNPFRNEHNRRNPKR